MEKPIAAHAPEEPDRRGVSSLMSTSLAPTECELKLSKNSLKKMTQPVLIKSTSNIKTINI